MKRRDHIAKLKAGDIFDLIVIGGGATGCGTALDAASRGLSVALVEKNDFAEGTSGRSTKLLHGGVRYLESAVKHLDRVQYHLVKDALRERGILLRIAPHLSSRLPLLTPLYRWWEIPYILAGLKLYDLLAGPLGIGSSRLLGRRETLRRYPMLKAQGLKAGVLYYDGQFNDARMAVSIILTAVTFGATVANHVEATGFLRENGRISGIMVKDSINGDAWPISARGVINATGPFSDRVRLMDDPAAPPIIKPSEGIHLLLDKRFAPLDTGLLIPRTDDGRVLFVLPWKDHALVGTTDDPAEVSEHPRPTRENIRYLLQYIRRYFNIQASESDVKAVWAGIRPLVLDPKAVDTAKLSRDHVIRESPSGLISVSGGKWTTYRKMAGDAVNYAVQRLDLQTTKACWTDRITIAGGEDFDPDGGGNLAAEFGFSPHSAGHLNRSYGSRAVEVARIAGEGFSLPLAQGHPYLEAEVIYAARHEFAHHVMDVLARRTSLALLDTAAARAAAPRVLDLMAEELGWDAARRREEELMVTERLDTSI
ncbi:MAG TPA: FAD-dependent oxidoreductase [Proteobacteria bacterium]|nr:aerobic glycerol-3-phosphate dehydrogenase [bacterium BMS3Abin14]HDL53915.1 FAD-dependent oxidoreductase [Pseudomonadota bacterium]